MEKTKKINDKSESKEKSKVEPKKSEKIKKSGAELKIPQTPYFLFCSKQREELIKKGIKKTLTAKELSAMWEKLPNSEKKVFIDQYEEEKKKYNKLKNAEEEKKAKKKSPKTKAKTNKAEIDENNSKACNCGKCAECKKRKTKEKNPKEEGKNKKEEKITISKKNKDISEKNKYIYKFKIGNRRLITISKKNKDISEKNKIYKFTVGSRRLKAFGEGGKLAGAAVGAIGGVLSSGVSIPSMIVGAARGIMGVNFVSSTCDKLGAVHVCLLLGDDIFEYSDKGYERHKNVGKTSEYDWDDNFEIIGETKVTPDELEEKIIKSNEWIKDNYDAITHNCHSFVKFCCDIIEPDPTIMSIKIVNVPQCRLFRAW